MKNYTFLLLICITGSVELTAQQSLPTDFLSNEFHAKRREAFRALLPEHAAVVIFAYPTRIFSRDIDYVYHPNPDLYYLTGYAEPDAMLILFKDPQTYKGKNYNELFFVQGRNPDMETFTGKRLGVTGVQSKLGIKDVYFGADFKNFPVDFTTQYKIIFAGIPLGMVDDESDTADLFDLVQQFKLKAGLPPNYDNNLAASISFLPTYLPVWNQVLPYLKERMAANEKYAKNELFAAFVNSKDSLQRDSLAKEVKKIKYDNGEYRNIVNKLRGIKTDEEMGLIRKAVEISGIGHLEAMMAIHPQISEREIQGIHEFVHKKYGAEYVGYGSIVGAGNNGCTLHYEANASLHVGNQLVLMDIGAEYHGYSADITRTVPANGKFSPEQKIIYELVLKAQDEIFKICKSGTPFDSLQAAARRVLGNGLLELGIIKKMEEVDTYYPHGCSHHMGLDVHDRGDYDILQKGMVITVEPGIYIQDSSACDKKWWEIGVRIEDDVMIRDRDFELLSGIAPRTVADIEKTMAMKSPFKNFVLPVLPSANNR